MRVMAGPEFAFAAGRRLAVSCRRTTPAGPVAMLIGDGRVRVKRCCPWSERSAAEAFLGQVLGAAAATDCCGSKVGADAHVGGERVNAHRSAPTDDVEATPPGLPGLVIPLPPRRATWRRRWFRMSAARWSHPRGARASARLSEIAADGLCGLRLRTCRSQCRARGAPLRQS